MAKKLKTKTHSSGAKVKMRAKLSSPNKLPQADKTGEEEIKRTRIRVIGIGGGGGNIVSEIASKISKASFVVANTDVKSLKSCSKKVIKFQFGQNLTHGLGTGMNPELASTAAQNEKEKIKKLCQGYDLCILVASLGGGTGSGAVSTFAKISRNLGNLTYGIFTLPFKFEGEKKTEIALNVLKEARVYFNAITVIPNERVFHVVNKDTPLKEALSTVNKFLSESLGGLIETIYEPGLINIDFADFRTVLEGKGRLAYLNAVKEDGAKNIVDTVLKSPFYPYTIRGAKGVLFNIIGEKNLSLSDVNQISKAISELVNPEAKIIFGISQQKNHSHSVRTVLLATGCDRSEEIRTVPEKKKKKKKKSVLVKNEKTEKPKVEKLKPKVVRKKKKKKPKEEPKKETKENEDTTRVSDESKDSSSRFADARVGEEKVRKNALQIKKETEEMEREMAEKEKFWETPAFLRRK